MYGLLLHTKNVWNIRVFSNDKKTTGSLSGEIQDSRSHLCPGSANILVQYLSYYPLCLGDLINNQDVALVTNIHTLCS